MEKYLVKDAQEFSEERFTKVNIIRNKKSSAFLLNFLPGQVMKSHNHPDRELYLHVIQGNGVFLIDDEELLVEKGDVIYCGEEEQIGFTNTGGDNVSIFATMTKMSD